jgi:NAD(P)-dependent dehydrogenase (short-subunit alcohol dehydrogenase family)
LNNQLLHEESFKNKTVLITGGGYGIGKQIALAFGQHGADVVVAARSTDKLKDVAAELRQMGTDPLAVPTDIGREEDVKALVDAALEKYQKIDILVNNAAISGPTATVGNISGEQWREAVNINLNGTFYCCKYVSQAMLKAGKGNIITLSSVGGRTAYPLRSPYCVTRWGVIGLSHTLAAELGPEGIRVNAVVPGPIEGDRSNNVFKARTVVENKSLEEVKQQFTGVIPIGRLPTESEVANTVLFLASELSLGIHGQTIQVDGGYRMQ